jgi:hypothetical protein
MKRAALAALVAGAVLLSAGRAAAQHGQFVGSFHRTEGVGEGDLLRFRYDIGTREAAPAGVDLDLRMSLQFQQRPGESNSDLLRSRFFADLRRSALRLHTQFVPWQATSAGASPPRERDVQVGADFTPPRAPRLTLNYSTLARDRADGRAESEDRRAEVSYALGSLSADVSFRRLDARPGGRDPVSTRTDEWQGELRGAASAGPLSGQAAYDALVTDFRQRERRREFTSHGIDLDGAWNPTRRFTLSASALGRWGRTDDNTLPSARSIDERYVSGSAQTRPLTGLDLTLLAESRSRRADSGHEDAADYLQAQGNFRRAIRQGFAFQTGFARTFPFESGPGEVPHSSAYAFVDGRLRKGVEGRAEVRGSRPDEASAGTQWHRLVQFRTRPLSTTRLDVTWSKDTQPIATTERRAAGPADSTAQIDTLTVIEGISQEDRLWEITGGYDPRPSATLVASVRWLDGEGRIDRSERVTTLTATWRAARRTTLTWNWSARRARSTFEAVAVPGADGEDTIATRVESETSETVHGVDITGRLPGDYRVTGSWHRTSWSGREKSVTYGVTIDRSF